MLASVTIDNRAGFPALLSVVSRDYISEEHSLAKESLMARAVMIRCCNCGAAT